MSTARLAAQKEPDQAQVLSQQPLAASPSNGAGPTVLGIPGSHQPPTRPGAEENRLAQRCARTRRQAFRPAGRRSGVRAHRGDHAWGRLVQHPRRPMRSLAPGRRCTHHRAARAACKSAPSTESRRPVRTATMACKRKPRPVRERPSPALVLARDSPRSDRMPLRAASRAGGNASQGARGCKHVSEAPLGRRPRQTTRV